MVYVECSLGCILQLDSYWLWNVCDFLALLGNQFSRRLAYRSQSNRELFLLSSIFNPMLVLHQLHIRDSFGIFVYFPYCVSSLCVMYIYNINMCVCWCVGVPVSVCAYVCMCVFVCIYMCVCNIIPQKPQLSSSIFCFIFQKSLFSSITKQMY